MVTTPQEYYSKLGLLLNENPPIYALLPSAENIYNIDINTRIVNAPKFLGVRRDHKAETIYFIVDRYAGYMDLSQTSCIITYTNANKETRTYFVPFYDIYTYATNNKMLIPWCLDATVFAAAGNVEFTIQFYKVDMELDIETGKSKAILSYNLNTLPAVSSVKNGMEISKLDSNYELPASQAEQLHSRIDSLEEYQQLYWTILD